MNYMVPQASVQLLPSLPPDPLSSFDSFVAALLTIILFIIIIILFIIFILMSLFYFILIVTIVTCELLSWFNERRDHDLEEGERTIHQPEDNPHSSHQAGARSNLRIWASLDRIVEDIEARKRQNQQALEKLPSPVYYGSKEVASAYIVCVICLEEFENGQSCQVFSQCNHIFHSNCIGRWLKRRLTCPICRVSVSDV